MLIFCNPIFIAKILIFILKNNIKINFFIFSFLRTNVIQTGRYKKKTPTNYSSLHFVFHIL